MTPRQLYEIALSYGAQDYEIRIERYGTEYELFERNIDVIDKFAEIFLLEDDVYDWD